MALIESLLANREPPDHVRARTRARRQAASELAQAAVSATLARRPYFAGVAQLGTRLLSRYFDDADAAVLLMGDGYLQVFASSGPRWPASAHVDGVLGYALDVVESGSTLIVPDLAAIPGGASRASASDWRLLVAVPVRSSEGIAIGTLALADPRPVPFDVPDLGLLEHVAERLGEIFSGAEGARLLQGPGVLFAESWRYGLGCEAMHLGNGQSLVIALASLPVGREPTILAASREQMDRLERAIDTLVARLPPRTALGRLTPETLAAYSLVDDPEAGERTLLSLIESLEEEPHACVAVLSASGLAMTDGGAALLDIVHRLLDAAMARGPATAVRARLSPTAIDRRLVAS